MTTFEGFSWRRTRAPGSTEPGYRTDDVFFIDASTGWAVNSAGSIIKTSDGGDSWVAQAEFEDVYLRSVGFANANVGWVGTLTSTHRLLHTTDGGASWRLVNNLPPGSPPAICGLSVVDANTVYGSGTNFPDRPAAIVKTTDGGATWTAINMSAHAAILVDIYFKNAMEGWVVGGRDDVGQPMARRKRDDVEPVVLHTVDGGATWTDRLEPIRRQMPRGEWGWKIQALDAQTMFVSLENLLDGAILRSDDGGLNWQRLRINDRQRNSNLEGIGFVDRDRGWVGGWGDIDFVGGFTSATADGGTTWDDANQIGFRLNRFRFIGNPVTVGYASGDTVYKFTDEPAPAGIVAGAVAAAAAERRMLHGRAVSIDVDVPNGARRLKVNVWDRFGRHVHLLADEIAPEPGARRLTWDFRDVEGEQQSAGAYILRVSIDGKSTSHIAYRTDR
jgi:photosystem II stability/assembly factor-like uncharacterized protein